ncbi:hypothetical protein [Citrobacter sp. CtB7.12]|uniref:hypothetical protein n=1 Tax=Citrobacter sp. CtB7.12 TaxID=1696093 RepID=UPI0006BA47A5|nr:hypothetical protein [Citrobacter sp. CtB7.12]
MTDNDWYWHTETEGPDVTDEIQEMSGDIMLRRALARLRKKLLLLNENAETRAPSWLVVRLNHTMTLSDLRRFAGAYGCKISVDVELPDGTHYGFVL